MQQAKDRGQMRLASLGEAWLLPCAWLLTALAYSPWPWLPYHSTKWIVFHGVAILGLLLVAHRKREWPVLPGYLGPALALTALLAVVHLVYFRRSAFLLPALDRLTFVAFLFAGWSFFRGTLRWEHFRVPLAAALFSVSAYGLFQFATASPSGISLMKTGSFFGHTNIAAQFIAIGLLVLAALPWPPAKTWTGWLGTVLTAVAALAYLFLSRGRSVQIGFVAGSAAFAWLRFGGWGGSVLRKRSLLPGVALLGCLVLLAALLAAGLGLRPTLQKGPLALYRWDLWQRTLPLIRDNPLGVGPDAYEFRILPYQRGGVSLSESFLAASPHNEWLRYLAEDGIPLSLLFLALLAWLFTAWWRKGGPGRLLVLPLGIFLFLEGCVQFPFSLAFSSLVATTLLAYVASTVIDGRAWPRSRYPRLVIVGFALVLLAGWCLEVVSRRFETSADVAQANWACRLMPGNWRACLQSARTLAVDGRLTEARVVLEGVLELEPGNVAAMRHLGLVAGLQGDRMEACFLTWKYDDAFGGKSTVRPMYEKNCPARWREYFDRKRPQMYYGGWRPGAVGPAGKDGLREFPLPPPIRTEP